MEREIVPLSGFTKLPQDFNQFARRLLSCLCHSMGAFCYQREREREREREGGAASHALFLLVAWF